MAEPETRFDVFLSHNSKDKPAVIALAKRLQANGVKVWLDAWELRPGQPWQEALEDIICRTGFVIPFVTFYSLARHGCTHKT